MRASLLWSTVQSDCELASTHCFLVLLCWRCAQVVYAITTPFLCSVDIESVIAGTLNTAATSIMKSLNIPLIDLHTPIINKCGQVPISVCALFLAPNTTHIHARLCTVAPQDCFGIKNCFCPHCPGAGYEFLANTTIAPAIRALLGA